MQYSHVAGSFGWGVGMDGQLLVDIIYFCTVGNYFKVSFQLHIHTSFSKTGALICMTYRLTVQFCNVHR